MQLQRITLGRKAITYGCILNPNPDSETVSQEEHSVIAKEAPLPELTKAFGALPPFICRIIEAPADWAEGVAVTKMAISYTKQGTKSVMFKFTKVLNISNSSAKLHTFETPWVRIEKPVEGESGSMEVSAKEAKLILAAIRESERYAEGKRSQQRLDLESDAGSAGINHLADKGRDSAQLELVK